MSRFRFLHLTDLHAGKDPENLSPVIADALVRDIRRVSKLAGGQPELVIFSGDLVFSGREFDAFTRFMNTVWNAFEDPKPFFAAVPGNHDLVRPSEDRAAALALRRWDASVAKHFWGNSSHDCRVLVEDAFSDYTAWMKNRPYPKMPDAITGILPGDFAASFEKDDLRVGLVGLNCTFLQLADGDYEGRLELHSNQMTGMLGQGYIDWLRTHDVCLLATHQPTSWLSPQAAKVLKEQIAQPGWFAAHLCGHVHRPHDEQIAIGGDPARRLLLGRALSGTDDGGGVWKRLHGYSFGELRRVGDKISLRLWPRRGHAPRSGRWTFDADTSEGTLDDDDGTPAQLIDGLRQATRKKNSELPPPHPPDPEHLGLRKTWHGTLLAADRILKHQQEGKDLRFSFDRISYAYRIEANGDQQVRMGHVVGTSKGVLLAGFFRIAFAVEDDAPAVAFLDDLGLLVRDLSRPRRDVAYLQTKNSGRQKQCAVFFLPEITAPTDRREIEVTYRWPRGAARLVTLGAEEWRFRVRSGSERIEKVEIAFDFAPTLGEVRCARTGANAGSLTQRRQADGWLRWRYAIAPAVSDEEYALTFQLPEEQAKKRKTKRI